VNTLKSDLKKRTPLLIACALVIAAALLSAPDVLAKCQLESRPRHRRASAGHTSSHSRRTDSFARSSPGVPSKTILPCPIT